MNKKLTEYFVKICWAFVMSSNDISRLRYSFVATSAQRARTTHFVCVPILVFQLRDALLNIANSPNTSNAVKHAILTSMGSESEVHFTVLG